MRVFAGLCGRLAANRREHTPGQMFEKMLPTAGPTIAKITMTTIEDKRRVLELFRVEVKLSGGVATVTGRLKIEKREFDLQQAEIEFRAKSDAAARSWPVVL